MSKIEYWSLGCDILGGPKDRAVKIATAQMPEIAKDIADAMNADWQEANSLRATLDTERELRTLGDTYAARIVDFIHGKSDGWPISGPYFEIRNTIERLRKALEGLIGAETKDELGAMELALRMMPGAEDDKIAAINAIHALLSCEAKQPNTVST